MYKLTNIEPNPITIRDKQGQVHRIETKKSLMLEGLPKEFGGAMLEETSEMVEEKKKTKSLKHKEEE